MDFHTVSVKTNFWNKLLWYTNVYLGFFLCEFPETERCECKNFMRNKDLRKLKSHNEILKKILESKLKSRKQFEYLTKLAIY